jgi:cation diffusion facilitator family transporter
VKVDAWHHCSDALSSVVVLVGIFFKHYIWWIDSALGIIVALIILHTAYEIVKEAVSKILGEDQEEEIVTIRQITARSCDQEVMAHHFHLHNYGRHQELTFHIKLEPSMTIAQGHALATKIEKTIEKELG